jgi:hypothetical protein
MRDCNQSLLNYNFLPYYCGEVLMTFSTASPPLLIVGFITSISRSPSAKAISQKRIEKTWTQNNNLHTTTLINKTRFYFLATLPTPPKH